MSKEDRGEIDNADNTGYLKFEGVLHQERNWLLPSRGGSRGNYFRMSSLSSRILFMCRKKRDFGNC